MATEDSKRTVIRNARLVDGSGAPETNADVVFEDGIIREVLAAGKAHTAHAHRIMIDNQTKLARSGYPR